MSKKDQSLHALTNGEAQALFAGSADTIAEIVAVAMEEFFSERCFNQPRSTPLDAIDQLNQMAKTAMSLGRALKQAQEMWGDWDHGARYSAVANAHALSCEMLKPLIAMQCALTVDLMTMFSEDIATHGLPSSKSLSKSMKEAHEIVKAIDALSPEERAAVIHSISEDEEVAESC